MKKTFEVFWTTVAEDDLLGIVEFIANDNPQGARESLHNIKVATAKLYELPQRGRIVPELQKQGIARYREMVIKPWRVIYRIEAKRVYVLSVIDGRRNVEDILLARLLK